MENNQNEIKTANRKAMPKFILLCILGAVIGGAFGYYSVRLGLESLSGVFKSAGSFFGINIAPWLLIIAAVAEALICCPMHSGTNKLLKGWDGEDEAVLEKIERKLSLIIWISSNTLIVSFLLLAAVYSNGFKSVSEANKAVLFIASVVAFLAILIETIIFQQKCVDSEKKINPEKKASVYDTKFHKKWLDSCDEAEKIQIGKSAYKAYAATNNACSTIAIILTVGSLFFDFGLLPTLAVCIIWFVNQTAYFKEAMRLSKSGSKIS